MQGANWDTCAWEGVSGIDFKAEVDARSAHDSEGYYKKLVLLECLAEVMDGRHGEITEEEKAILHPHRLWRSLAIIQKALMLEPTSPEAFERSGEGGVETNVEKYLEIYLKDEADDKVKVKKGVVTIHVGSHGYVDGNHMLLASFRGGKQLNLHDGTVEFEAPDDMKEKTYTLTLDVCTVHLKQAPLNLSIDGGDVIPIEIPYTVGEWQTTKGVELQLSGGETLRFARQRPCFGMAIKKIILS
jgi:hypothetical protein